MKTDPLYFFAGFAGLYFGWATAFYLALVFVVLQFAVSLVLHFKVKKLYAEHEKLHAQALAQQGQEKGPLREHGASPATGQPGQYL